MRQAGQRGGKTWSRSSGFRVFMFGLRIYHPNDSCSAGFTRNKQKEKGGDGSLTLFLT